MNTSVDNPKVFLQNISVNTEHTISSLSEILDIPLKRIITNKFTETDYINMSKLKEIIINAKCHWIR